VFANTPEGYKSVTGSDKIYCDLYGTIDVCKKNNILYSICLMVTPELKDNYIEIYDFASNLGGVHFFTTELISKLGKGERIISLPTGKERVENIPAIEYFSRYKNNTCLNGKIAFSCNGVTLPCPMWEYPLSQMPKGDLLAAFKSGKVDSVWRFTKQMVEICKDCEYRLACSDCSVLEWALFKNKSIHNTYCSYTPERGEWI
jgi:radical SAM protein with 4Fe4S-binding SPASM domain